MSRVQSKAWKVGQLSLALTAVLVAAVFVIRDGFWTEEARLVVPEPVVLRLGPAPEDGKAAQYYTKLLEEQKYNAAFATNPTGGYGWGDHFARIEDAERFALAHCAAFGPDCRIVLKIEPETPVEIDGQPLSRTAARALAGYPDQNRYKAIAMTEHGGWGGAWGKSSKRDAIESALRGCRKHETTTAPGLEMTTKCRIIRAD